REPATRGPRIVVPIAITVREIAKLAHRASPATRAHDTGTIGGLLRRGGLLALLARGRPEKLLSEHDQAPNLRCSAVSIGRQQFVHERHHAGEVEYQFLSRDRLGSVHTITDVDGDVSDPQ